MVCPRKMMLIKTEIKKKYFCITHIDTECFNIFDEISYDNKTGKWDSSKPKGFCKKCNNNVYVKKGK
jgi:hypothetical protein